MLRRSCCQKPQPDLPPPCYTKSVPCLVPQTNLTLRWENSLTGPGSVKMKTWTLTNDPVLGTWIFSPSATGFTLTIVGPPGPNGPKCNYPQIVAFRNANTTDNPNKNRTSILFANYSPQNYRPGGLTFGGQASWFSPYSTIGGLTFGGMGSSLFPTISYVDHDCDPHLLLVFDPTIPPACTWLADLGYTRFELVGPDEIKPSCCVYVKKCVNGSVQLDDKGNEITLSGARVSIDGVGSCTTDESGSCCIHGLNPNTTYTVRVSINGYAEYVNKYFRTYCTDGAVNAPLGYMVRTVSGCGSVYSTLGIAYVPGAGLTLENPNMGSFEFETDEKGEVTMVLPFDYDSPPPIGYIPYTPYNTTITKDRYRPDVFELRLLGGSCEYFNVIPPMQPDDGYVCYPRCKIPVPTTLYLTDSYFGSCTLTYNEGSIFPYTGPGGRGGAADWFNGWFGTFTVSKASKCCTVDWLQGKSFILTVFLGVWPFGTTGIPPWQLMYLWPCSSAGFSDCPVPSDVPVDGCATGWFASFVSDCEDYNPFHIETDSIIIPDCSKGTYGLLDPNTDWHVMVTE